MIARLKRDVIGLVESAGSAQVVSQILVVLENLPLDYTPNHLLLLFLLAYAFILILHYLDVIV